MCPGISNSSDKKVKVLQATNIDMSVSKLLLPLIDALRESNYDVDICCAEGNYSRSLKEEGYSIIPIPFRRSLFTISHIRTFCALYSILKANKYDIVHFHTGLLGAIGRIAARCARCNIVIYTAHGFYSHENLNTSLKGIINLIEKALARWTTDWLFLQSEEDARLAKELKFLKRPDRILFISNGVMLDKFLKKYPVEDIRRNLGIDKDEKVIGFVGRVVAEKGIVELIDAFAQVRMVYPSVKLLIVGDTLDSDRDKDVKKEILKTIEEENIEKAVVFTGLRDDVPELLSAVDIFVLPSYREGMPKTIIEAMASGKPVITTRIRGCREEVIDGETGLLVNTKDSKQIAEAALKMIMDEEMAISMGKEGRKRAMALFDEKKVVERQLEVYERICAELLE